MVEEDFLQLKSWVDSYQPKVYKAACLVLHDTAEAEDVAQETFIRALGAMGRMERGTDVERWLCRISINLSLNCIRSRRREQAALSRISSDRSEPFESPFEAEDTRSAVGVALRRLPDRLRVPLILRYYLDFSEMQVASTLGVRLGTIKSRLHEARRFLAEDASVLEAYPGR